MASESAHLEMSVSLGTASFSASGAKEDVLALYEDFKKLTATNKSARSSQGKIEQDRQSSDRSSGPEVTISTELPLKPYVARLKLPGNKEKATAVIAWAAASGSEPALNIGELKKLWKKTPFRVPSNLPRDLGKAEAEGWLEREGKAGSPEARYSITGYGEDAMAKWIDSSDD